MTAALQCWKCGASLDDEPLPLAREARCAACDADLHVCRLCRWFDRSKAKSCAEPVAEEVRDKERANFCGYFEPRPGAHGGGAAGLAEREQLEALFGLEAGAAQAGAAPDHEAASRRRKREADAAREQLDRLFGSDES